MTDEAPEQDDRLLRALQAVTQDIAFPEMVRLLELRAGSGRPTGTTGAPAEEAMLFRAAPTLGFPAGELYGMALDDPAAPGRASLDVTFLGLYGPSSPLPSFWSERIVMDMDGAQNLRDFLDVFNHPAIAMAYRIWRHYRLYLDVTAAADDRCSRAALAVAGIPFEQGAGTAGRPAVPALPDVLDATRLLPFCGLLAQYARSAGALEAVVAGYLDVPVRVTEFLHRMVVIPADQQLALGTESAMLGTGVLGPRTQDVTGAIGLALGPLDSEAFRSFLPGEPARAVLDALVRLVLRDPLESQVELLLAADSPERMMLGGTQLGWTSWLAGPEEDRACPAGLA